MLKFTIPVFKLVKYTVLRFQKISGVTVCISEENYKGVKGIFYFSFIFIMRVPVLCVRNVT